MSRRRLVQPLVPLAEPTTFDDIHRAIDAALERQHRRRTLFPKPGRLFIGKYPCGIVYADRWNDDHGDYKRLAFLPYGSLVLDVEPGCPPELLGEITEHAATLQAQRGQPYQISTAGQTITLGVSR